MWKTIQYACVALVVVWLPLFLVGFLGISDNPVGLGIIAFLLTPVIVVAALLVLAFQFVTWLRTAERR